MIKKVLTKRSSYLTRYLVKSKTSQHMVQRQLSRFVIFVHSSTFLPNANRCIMSELILPCVPISFTFVYIFEWHTAVTPAAASEVVIQSYMATVQIFLLSTVLLLHSDMLSPLSTPCQKTDDIAWLPT